MKERKWPIIIYSVVSVLLLLLYVSLFPGLQSQSKQLGEVLKSMPAGLLKALGSSADQLSNFTLEALLASKQFSVVFQTMAAILAISIAVNDLAAEIERGTIEFLLSQPVSRLKLYFSRFFSGAILLITFTAFSTISVIPLAKMFNVAYQANVYFMLFFVGSLFALACYSFSYLISALSSTNGRVFGIAGGIIGYMYITFIVSTLKENLDKLKFVSFFHYFSADVIYNGIDKLAIWVFVLTIIICTTVGAVIFQRRDISA
ncbi:MAG: ABC transporter permease subunit [Candidatus Berkelbacteria bacterium]|nr:ABC transporter permease subunit [Candidatus Berkelbacteria bacterium]